jgi:hypothetical protein
LQTAQRVEKVHDFCKMQQIVQQLNNNNNNNNIMKILQIATNCANSRKKKLIKM